jgi:hypothetical protein
VYGAPHLQKLLGSASRSLSGATRVKVALSRMVYPANMSSVRFWGEGLIVEVSLLDSEWKRRMRMDARVRRLREIARTGMCCFVKGLMGEWT